MNLCQEASHSSGDPQKPGLLCLQNSCSSKRAKHPEYSFLLVFPLLTVLLLHRLYHRSEPQNTPRIARTRILSRGQNRHHQSPEVLAWGNELKKLKLRSDFPPLYPGSFLDRPITSHCVPSLSQHNTSSQYPDVVWSPMNTTINFQCFHQNVFYLSLPPLVSHYVD